MFGPPGHLYVYFSYGLHWCANVVCGPPGDAQAVLLRALDPVAGLVLMRQARWRNQRHRDDRDLCRGPGRLCQALGIDRTFDGADLTTAGAGVWVADDGSPPPADPLITGRVGLSVATDCPWRFAVKGHRAVGPRPRPVVGETSPHRPAWARRPSPASNAARPGVAPAGSPEGPAAMAPPH